MTPKSAYVAAALVVVVSLAACRRDPPPPPPTPVGASVCRAGVFLAVTGDPAGEGTPRRRYRVQEDGRITELTVPPRVLAAAGGLPGLARVRVEVHGVVEESEPERVRVERIERLAEGATPCAG